jgi:allantoinase
MNLYDLIIRNGMLVTPTGLRQADLAVADERIVALEPELSGTSREEIDARGLHVFPGVIDAHLHFNEPGRTEWEGFSTGSRALAAGGTTAFFDMPLNAHPPTLDAESFKLKHEAALASSYVDFALWGGLVPENLDRLEELAQCGVIGFKAFMSNSGIDDFSSADDYTLYEGMRRIASFKGLVAVHAENDQITQALARRAIAQGRTGIQDYLRSRPVVAELEAIERAILFAQETGCSLHIVHVSTGRGVRLVAEAQARGVDVSCETCPHYLVLTEEDVEELGAVAKCAPPLRPKAEQDQLWEHIFAGILPMVASDHSPAPASMKTSANFFSVWGGISGCQSLLSLLLTEGYTQRGLPLSVIASVTSGYVARRFKLFPRKGELAVGTDADITLVDLKRSVRLDADDLLYRHRHSPYVGRTMSATIMRTLVRGRTIYRDGSIEAQPAGRLLTPHSHAEE